MLAGKAGRVLEAEPFLRPPQYSLHSVGLSWVWEDPGGQRQGVCTEEEDPRRAAAAVRILPHILAKYSSTGLTTSNDGELTPSRVGPLHFQL